MLDTDLLTRLRRHTRAARGELKCALDPRGVISDCTRRRDVLAITTFALLHNSLRGADVLA